MAKLLVIKTALTKRAHAEEALKNYDKVITTNFNSFPLYKAIEEAKKLGHGTVVNFAGVTATLFDNFDVNVINEKGRVVRYSSYSILDSNDYYGYLTVVARCAKAGIKVLFGNKKPNLKEAEKLPVKFASYAQVQEVKNFLHKWCKDSSNLERVNYYTTKQGETIATYDGGDGNMSYTYKKEIKLKTKFFFKEDKFITYTPNFTYIPTGCKGKNSKNDDTINFTINGGYTVSTRDTDAVSHIDNIVTTERGNKFNLNTVVLNDTKHLTGLVHKLSEYHSPVIDKATSSYKHKNYLFTDADVLSVKDEKGVYQPAPLYNIADTPEVIKQILPLFKDIFGFDFNYEAVNENEFLGIVKYYLHNYFTDMGNEISYNQLMGISKLIRVLNNELRGWVPAKDNNLGHVEYIIDIKLYDVDYWNRDGGYEVDTSDDDPYEGCAEMHTDSEYENDFNPETDPDWWYTRSNEFSDEEFEALDKYHNISCMLYADEDVNPYPISANYFIAYKDKFDDLFRSHHRSGYKIKVKFDLGKKPE